LKQISSIKLLLVFAIVFSFISLPGGMSSFFHLPTIPLARADSSPTPINCQIAPSTSVGCEPWVPAGAAVNTYLATSYKGSVDEFTTGLQGNQIDAVDETLTPSEVTSLGGGSCPTASPVVFYCTTPINEHGYFEIQFDLANTGQTASTSQDSFWGIPMQFGNSAKGVEIRQAIAHLIDKILNAADNAFIKGKATAIDNPLPPCGFSLPSSTVPACVNGGAANPEPCQWDTKFLENVTGTPGFCEVGAPGGTAYHIAPASTGGVSACGQDLWSPCPGSPDFCAAATHFVNVGLAGGKDPTTCVLTSLNSTAIANAPQFFIRDDSLARHTMGEALAKEICAVFTGTYGITTSGCSGTPASALSILEGPFSAFVGFTTSTTGTPLNNWGMYTAAFINVFPFDSSLYFEYNSLFASCAGTISASVCTPNSPCLSTTPTAAAGNYMYVCSPAYDSISSQMEFAPSLNLASPTCISPTGTDPSPPAVQGNQPKGTTFGFCNNKSNVSVLDGVSAAYQAQDLYGKNVFTLPLWDNIDTFAYTRNFPAPAAITPNAANFENEQGGVLTGLPGFPNWLNAWCQAGVPQSSSTCSVANTAGTAVSILRQGFAQPTTSINPYIASSFWDFDILGNVYDSLGFTNPMQSQPLANYDWMTSNSRLITSLGYTPTCLDLFGPRAGTDSPANCNLPDNQGFRMSLRSDNVWQDGQPVTSWDVRYSYLTLNQTGSFQGAGLSPLNDVHVLSKFQMDLVIRGSPGPFTLNFLLGPTIIPGNYWSACGVLGSNTWNSDVAAGNVPDACMLPASGGGVNTGSVFNSHFDPMTQVNPITGTTGIVVGSSAWDCQSTTGVLGGACSSSGTQSPPIGGTWTLTRNGCTASSTGTTCSAPGHSQYFRSSGALSLFLWATSGPGSTNAAKLSGFLSCFGPVKTGCGHYEEGIGNASTSTINCPCSVGAVQLSEFLRFVFSVGTWLPTAGNNGVGDFTTYTGVAVSPPILYEGVSTLNPARLVGCTPSTPAYPNGGGYDC